MQSDPRRCYSLNTKYIIYPNWLHKKLKKGPDQTAHPCNLIGAVINHFITRVTNKIVPRRNVLLHLGLIHCKCCLKF